MTARQRPEGLVVEMPQGDEWREVPCWVRAEAAGGGCKRPSVVRVYGIPFCEDHGAEARAGALEELYADASFALDQMQGGYPAALNPEVLEVLRAGQEGIDRKAMQTCQEGDEALLRAYPYRPELMDEDFRDREQSGGQDPETWCRDNRNLIHKLMRLAFEDGATYLVEPLTLQREHVSAQLAYVIAHNRCCPALCGAGEEDRGDTERRG